ncbi:MAG: PrsW family intramembrane metalloprotease [Lachnospiraceae bacterium]|nr:PrsW family intramembrane metalloprotease [Lachnospiraceae bacterium]
MFYYLAAPIAVYNIILIAAAVIPAFFLMVRVYRSDRLDKESTQILWQLVKAGILAALLALVEEKILFAVAGSLFPEESTMYNVILYFVIVAGAEESSKYIFMRRATWNSPEFNCQYDGVVYAVFTSLGFALWENISYVLHYGFSTALVRAVTAIPGHACFGVFMGVFYGLARRSASESASSSDVTKYNVLSILVPMLLHGAYDFIATMEETGSGLYFLIFTALLFFFAYRVTGRSSKEDRYI